MGGMTSPMSPMPPMSHHLARSGFSLTEMLVVISILIAVSSTALPGLLTQRTRNDIGAADKALTWLHSGCQRQAQQIGSANLVFGFTVNYDAGRKARTATPWVIDRATGEVHYGDEALGLYAVQDPSTSERRLALALRSDIPGTTAATGIYDLCLREDLGRTYLWQGRNVVFKEAMLPTGDVAERTYVDDGNPATYDYATSETPVASRYLHVGYEARTGLPYSLVDASASPAANALMASANNRDLLIPLRSPSGAQRLTLAILKTGVCNPTSKP